MHEALFFFLFFFQDQEIYDNKFWPTSFERKKKQPKAPQPPKKLQKTM